MIVVALRQPAVEAMIGEPLAPQPLRGHAAVDAAHRNHHAGADERKIHERLIENRARVLLLEPVEDIAIPDVDAVLDEQLEGENGAKRAGENPGAAIAVASPELPRRAPKMTHQPPARGVIQLQLSIRKLGQGPPVDRLLSANRAIPAPQ